MRYLTMAFLLLHLSSFSQEEEADLIQFSGVIVSPDSLAPIPFAHILIKGTYRGTISDYYGFFSFVAQKSDTIQFSSVGFKDIEYAIPDTLSTNRYSLIQMMVKDTLTLAAAIIYPWPSIEEFKDAFLNLDVNDDDLERARKNLERAALKEQFEAMPMDASMNYKYAMQQKQSQLYYAGQYPSISLLNPIAWAKFINAWKRGDFKNKKKK